MAPTDPRRKTVSTGTRCVAKFLRALSPIVACITGPKKVREMHSEEQPASDASWTNGRELRISRVVARTIRLCQGLTASAAGTGLYVRRGLGSALRATSMTWGILLCLLRRREARG